MGEKGGNDFEMVQMNLEKDLRKEIQKKWKRGQALMGQPRLPFGPDSGPACLPPPPLSRAWTPASSQPASATWRPYAGDGRTAADRLHLVGTPARALRPLHSLCRPHLSPSSLHSRAQPQPYEICRSAIAGAAPLLTAGHSSAPTSTPKPLAHSSSSR